MVTGVIGYTCNNNGIVVNIYPGTGNVVHGSTTMKDSPSLWVFRLVRKYGMIFHCNCASARPKRIVRNGVIYDLQYT